MILTLLLSAFTIATPFPVSARPTNATMNAETAPLNDKHTPLITPTTTIDDKQVDDTFKGEQYHGNPSNKQNRS
jgi:hypothetical protein